MERFKSPVVLIAIAVLVLVAIFIGTIGILKTTQSSIKPAPTVQSSPDKQVLRNNIQSAFNSKDGKGILAYLDLAFEQKQPLQSYDYLKKTFDKMTASYNSVKGAEKKIAMGKLKVYASNLPNYKASDFVIPK